MNCRVKISLTALVTLSACGDVVDETPMQVSISVASSRAARPMPGCPLDAPGSRIKHILDGIARHTPEGYAFQQRVQAVRFKQAVRERDEPFGDFGSERRP